MRKISWSGVLAAVTSVIGLTQLPEVSVILHTPTVVSPTVALSISAIGAVFQALTHPIRHQSPVTG